MWGVSTQWAEALAFGHDLSVTGVSTLSGEELAEINPSSWSWSRKVNGSQVTDSMSFSCVDDEGFLFSPDPSAPLRSNGQRVALMGTLSSGQWEESIPLGVWRIEESVPTGGVWRLYRNGKWARPAQTIDVDGIDLLELITEYDWLGLSTPKSGANSLTEIQRIVDGALPVVLGTTAKSVPSVPWEGSRIDALMQVVSDMDAVLMIDRVGTLITVPKAGSGKVISITPANGQDVMSWGLGLIDWKAPSSREGVYNGVVTTGTNAAGDTLYGRALEESGPAKWSSAGYGRKLYGHHSPLLTTQGQVDQGAATMLKSLQRDRAQTVTITTIPDFALDVLDTARILLPGTDRSVDGLITGIAMSNDNPMVLDVSIPWEVRIHG